MNSTSIPMMRNTGTEREKRKRRARRAGLFFDALSTAFGVLSALILMWLLVSWVDFCAHNLSRSFDFWLGNANLIYLICSSI